MGIFTKFNCPECGKRVDTLVSRENWAWKTGGKNQKLVCSYSCMRQWEKREELKKR